MADFVRLLEKCKATTVLSNSVVDDFLIYYTGSREKLEKEMDQRLARFRKITKDFPQNWINLIKAQYICHRIFKENGLIHKYLNHAAVKALPKEQLTFLQMQSAVPWRYCYSVITANPEKDFYEMEDVFNGDSLLLYSPSVTQILSQQPVSLWFNLTAYNGSCWQTFGPIVHFRGFEPDDIFFFATELHPGIETEVDLYADIEENPFPYLMLFSASNFPFTMHGNDPILQVIAEHSMEAFDSKARMDLQLEYVPGVFRIKPSVWGKPPHFAAAYYDEQKKTILLTAMTDRGFHGLVTRLNKYGLYLPDEPDIRVHLTVVIAIKNILQREVELNPYEKLFEVETKPADKDMIARVNRFISLALPFINSGQEPDVVQLAKEAGIDIDTARDLLQHSMGSVKKLKEKIDKRRK